MFRGRERLGLLKEEHNMGELTLEEEFTAEVTGGVNLGINFKQIALYVERMNLAEMQGKTSPKRKGGVAAQKPAQNNLMRKRVQGEPLYQDNLQEDFSPMCEF